MPCYSPLSAWKTKAVNPKTGKNIIAFSYVEGGEYMPLKCNQCIGCRLDRSKEFALRIIKEAEQYGDNNSFITLTYKDDPGTLCKKHFQDFMKRLRSKYPDKKIRFYHVGEYGEKRCRPHYHAILFNHHFTDRYIWSVRDGVKLYRSPELEKLWEYGFSTIGEVTWESACYCARYCVSKITGKAAPYEKEGKLPPYATMSLKPGLGLAWFEKSDSEPFKHGFCVDSKGRKVKIPTYYDKKYAEKEPEKFKELKKIRIRRAKEDPNSRPERLTERHLIKQQTASQLRRDLSKWKD